MTEKHLTFRQIEEYRAKRLDGDRIVALYRHVDACPACRDMLVQTVVGSNAEHLSEQQAVNCVAGRLSGAESVAVETASRELRSVRGDVERSKSISKWCGGPFAIGFAAGWLEL